MSSFNWWDKQVCLNLWNNHLLCIFIEVDTLVSLHVFIYSITYSMKSILGQGLTESWFSKINTALTFLPKCWVTNTAVIQTFTKYTKYKRCVVWLWLGTVAAHSFHLILISSHAVAMIKTTFTCFAPQFVFLCLSVYALASLILWGLKPRHNPHIENSLSSTSQQTELS